jgi:uncharacterized protein (TIGR02452 family)
MKDGYPEKENRDGSPGKEKKRGLVQTIITSAFFSSSSKASSSTTKSPYFTKPAAQGPSTPPATNLYPERRANRPTSTTQPPPLPRQSSSFRSTLVATAEETQDILPHLLKLLPDVQPRADLYSLPTLQPLPKSKCPNLPPAPIEVLNSDTLDAALAMSPNINSLSFSNSRPNPRPVLILNMANAIHAGGGWKHGALAQEESLCYRSSLSFTLKRRFYPMKDDEAIYSPRVVVFRSSLATGHRILDLGRPTTLPVVSVVSVAAIEDPETEEINGGECYRYAEDEELMQAKMRLILRIAVNTGHRRLVLGALGCGAFGNPRGEVCRLWKEVLLENEFKGWWEKVCFAIYEPSDGKDGQGNYGVFWRGLNGLGV